MLSLTPPLFVSLVIFGTGLLFADSTSEDAESYLESALDRIEQTLVRPSDAYGFILTDTFDHPKDDLGHGQEVFSFFTMNGDVQYKHDSYEVKLKSSEVVSKEVAIYLHSDRLAKLATSVRDRNPKFWSNVLRINIQSPAFMVGVSGYDRYACICDQDQRLAAPHEQPFQILANPCFATVGVTPMELRRWERAELPRERGCRVYELRKKADNCVRTLRLHFDPSLSDALVESEFAIGTEDGMGNSTLQERTVRRVEQWQSLPGGQLVPSLFTSSREENAEVDFRLSRQISKPTIGRVDSAMFDDSRLPAFHAKWIEIVDEARLQKEGPKAATQYPQWRGDSRWTMLAVLNGAILIVLLCVWAYRRFRARS